jgi:hypothetical protein
MIIKVTFNHPITLIDERTKTKAEMQYAAKENMKYLIRKKIYLNAILLFFFLAVDANAYIDAGTGSLFIQIIIAFVAAGLYSFKIFWKKIWMFIKSIGKSSGNDKPSN